MVGETLYTTRSKYKVDIPVSLLTRLTVLISQGKEDVAIRLIQENLNVGVRIAKDVVHYDPIFAEARTAASASLEDIPQESETREEAKAA